MAVFSDTIRYVNCMAEKYPGVLWNIKHCKFVHCSNSIADTLAMQWYTLSEYWCTGTEAGTHQQSLGFVPYLLFGPAVKSVSAGRVGAKFIPTDKSCTKAKVSRQEPVAGDTQLLSLGHF